MKKPSVKLLMTTSDLAGGGAEREFCNLLRGLDRETFDMHVCLWRADGAYGCPPDLEVTILDKTRAWHLPRTVWRLARLVDRLQPDVVFSMLHYPNLVTGLALRLCRHRPRWVCRFVNDPVRSLGGAKRPWARWVLPRADRVLGCSKGVRDALVRWLALDESRAGVMPNPVDVASIEAQAGAALPIEHPADVFCLVHAGRLTPQKNQALLLRAYAKLADAELWMLGEGPLETALKEDARALGIREPIRWLGFQANPFPFFKAADVFVLSSDWEGSPNVLVEAMACGAAVVSTRCPYGPDELIQHEQTGLLVPVGDAEALAGALLRLQRDASLRRQLGQNARAWVQETYGGGRVLEQYVAAFTSVRADHSG